MIFIPYLIFFLFLFTSHLVIQKRDNIKSNIDVASYFLFYLIVISMFLGLRGFLFTDWMNYYLDYKNMPTGFGDFIVAYKEGNIRQDIGFSAFMYLCRIISPNYFYFQFVLYSVDIAIIYYALRRFASKYVILNFLFFYLFSGILIEVDLLRNSKSIALFFLSLIYVRNKNPKKYILLNLLGCLFHVSALVYIVLYPILRIKPKKIFYVIFFFFTTLLMVLHISVITPVINTFVHFLPNGQVLVKLLRYLNNEHYSSASVFSPIFLERILTFLVFIANYNRLKNKSENFIFLNIFCIYYFMCFGFWDFYIVVQRGALLFICSYWYLYPEIYGTLRTHEKKMVFLAILLAFGSFKFIRDYDDSYRKYTMAFNEMPYEEKAPVIRKLVAR